jgi:type I restriction enzyme S subunit
MSDLSEFAIGVPNERTETILARLERLDEDRTFRLDRIDRHTRLLEERKHALITAAVTGQFDVTTARAVA